MALAIQNMGFLRGPVARVHARDAGDQRLGADLVQRRPDAGRVRVPGAARARVDRLHRRRLPPHAARPTRTARCSRRCGARAPCRWLGPGERLATMAALLHRDARRRRVRRPRCVRASGLDAARLGARATCAPTCARSCTACCAHELAFMPHGENLILVLDGHVPVARAHEGHRRGGRRARATAPLPARRRAHPAVVDDDEQALAIFTDVFDGVLRHLAAILDTDGVLPQDDVLGARARVRRRARGRPPGPAGGRRPARRAVRALVPQPAAAAQHPADGRPRRPVVVAHLRRHAGQPDRTTVRSATRIGRAARPRRRTTWRSPASRGASPRATAARQIEVGPLARRGAAGRAHRGRRASRGTCSRVVPGWPTPRSGRTRRSADDDRAFVDAYVDGVNGGRRRRRARRLAAPRRPVARVGRRSGSCSSTTRCSRRSRGCSGTSTCG